MDKQVEFRHDKTESHQGDSCSQPGQVSSFVSEDGTGIGLDGHHQELLSGATLVFPNVREDLRIAQGSVLGQIGWLMRTSFPYKFRLIYCDPPFFSNKTYQGAGGAFSDEWSSLETYLAEIERWMRAIGPWLDPQGFFVLHCDYHASHYLKVLGDRIFDYENFRNEWVWHYSGRRQPAVGRVNSKHDVLLVWAKSASARFNPIFESWSRDEYVAMKRQKVYVDEDGREWIWGHQGRGKPHAYRIYLDQQVARGRAIDTVWDIPIINTSAKERVGYPTQKPLTLLSRIIELTTNPGDWIADFAAGSGTTGVAALGLQRKVWLGDVNADACAIMKQRIERDG